MKAELLLQGLIDRKKVPGLAITIFKQGELVFQKGYGYADLGTKKPIDPKKTLFRIASVSKPIAATALAHMVADNHIDLDASYYDYVPYYPKKEWNFSIRQLAGHTAGIRGYKGKEYGLNEPYAIKESITVFKNADLLFKPGTNYHYNSYGWVLISLAIQEASGTPFEVYVKEKVLRPLGMNTTFAPDPPRALYDKEADKEAENTIFTAGIERGIGKMDILSKYKNVFAPKENRATFYTKNRIGFRAAIPVNNFFKLAGGGYLSTSHDIAKLGQAYLEGRVLSKQAIAPFITSLFIHQKPTYYGLGWQVSEDREGRPYYGHVGNGVGGYSNFYVYPKEKIVFSVLINSTDPKIQEELDEVKNLFF